MVTGYLHTSGKVIQDSNNATIILRGLHKNGYWVYHLVAYGENYLSDITQSAWQSYANKGCNIVRFNGIFWGQAETSQPSGNGIPTDSNINNTWLQWLDKLALYSKNSGMYILFQCRDLNGGDGNEAGAGKTYPTWLSSGESADAFDQGFFTPSNSNYNAARQAFNNFMKYLAARYKDNPFVLLGHQNEPLWSVGYGNHTTTWNNNYVSVVNSCIAAVRASGYTNPFVVDVAIPDYGNLNPNDVSDNNVIWDAHVYSQNNNPAWLSYLDEFYTPYVTNLNRPLLIGEWGDLDGNALPMNNVQSPSESDSSYINNTAYQISVMNTRGLASTWFSMDFLYGNVSGWQGESQSATNSLMNTLFVGGGPAPTTKHTLNISVSTI